METTIQAIRDRVVDICQAAPFQFVQAVTPFDFTLQPSGLVDQVFRIEYADVSVTGGTNYSEERIGQLRIFVARKQHSTPQDAYAQLAADAEALLSSVIHDGSTGGGDYDVSDQGRTFVIQHDRGKEYAVLRLILPVNYEASV